LLSLTPLDNVKMNTLIFTVILTILMSKELNTSQQCFPCHPFMNNSKNRDCCSFNCKKLNLSSLLPFFSFLLFL
jgi:hypothetical protein